MESESGIEREPVVATGGGAALQPVVAVCTATHAERALAMRNKVLGVIGIVWGGVMLVAGVAAVRK
jgi:hypothetical protein